MINLLGSILLDQDYGPPAISQADFQNFVNWNVSFGVLNAINAGHINVSSAATGFNPSSTVWSNSLPFGGIDISYGSNFRITVTVTTNTSTSIRAIAYFNGVALSPPGAFSAFVSVNGTATIELDFNPGAFTFDEIRLQAFSDSVANHTIDYSDISLESTDASLYDQFNPGDRILVYWDHDADDFFVQREDNPGGVLTTITAGPNLGDVDVRNNVTGLLPIPRDPIPGDKIAIRSEYQFCDELDLVRFPFTSFGDFPYFTKFVTINASECTVDIIVCDVHFDDEPVRTPANSKFTNEGSVQLSAVSSHGDVRYSTTHGNTSGLFQNLTNTTGLFTGLYPGVHTFYAVDQYNCFTAIDVVVDVIETTTYNPKYRLQYYDIQTHVQTLIQILERGYSGDVIDIYGTDNPIMIGKTSGELNNKFDALRPTFAEFNVVSQKNLQFQGMFSQDDKKYKLSVTHGEFTWIGFQVPSTFSQGWTPNQVEPLTLKFGDNLARLGDFDFLDESGNAILGDRTLLAIIALILKKTDLNLDIVSCINKFADGHATGDSDDPLPQTLIECLCFYDEDLTPMKCDAVLSAILTPLGAEIIQNNSAWHILETDGKVATYKFRRFDYTGAYIENGTIDPIQEITAPEEALENIYFARQDHLLEIIAAYGTMNIVLALNARKSIFPLSLDQWQLNSNGGNLAYGVPFLVPDKHFNGYRFYNLDAGVSSADINLPDTLPAYNAIKLISPAFAVKSLNDSVKIAMKYTTGLLVPFVPYGDNGDNVTYNPSWNEQKWQLKLVLGATTYYYSELIGWTTDVNFIYNYIYVEDFSKEQSFEKQLDLPAFPELSDITLQLIFHFSGSVQKHFSSKAGLRAIVTDGILPVGSRTSGVIGFTFWWYKLIASGEADSVDGVSIIRPDDFDALTNAVVWEADQEGPASAFYVARLTNFLQVQELYVNFLPNKQEPIEKQTITLVNNPNYQEVLNYPLIAGDIPTEIPQYQIYTNIFKLADGTPTSNWARVDTNEIGSIQVILLRSIGNQYNKPSWRLGGSWVGPNIQFISIIKHTIPAVEFVIEDSDAFNGGAWSETGAGQAWILTSPIASVSFDDTHTGNSLVVKQPTELIAGQRIRLAFKLTRSSTVNMRIDRFVAVVYQNGGIVQKVTLFDGIQSDGEIIKGVSFTLDADGDTIGFYIENITGDGTVEYELEYFEGTGVTSIRYYYLNQYSRLDRSNLYRNEMVQLIPAVHDPDPTVDDTGGGNTGGDDSGGGVSGREYSSGFGSGFA